MQARQAVDGLHVVHLAQLPAVQAAGVCGIQSGTNAQLDAPGIVHLGSLFFLEARFARESYNATGEKLSQSAKTGIRHWDPEPNLSLLAPVWMRNPPASAASITACLLVAHNQLIARSMRRKHALLLLVLVGGWRGGDSVRGGNGAPTSTSNTCTKGLTGKDCDKALCPGSFCEEDDFGRDTAAFGNEHVAVRPSLIPGAGLGAFALRTFNRGERVSRYMQRVPRAEACTVKLLVRTNTRRYICKVAGMDRENLNGNAWKLNATHSCDGENIRLHNPMRYVNSIAAMDSCARQNVEVLITQTHGHPRVMYAATRTITEGEELLVDYGEGYFKRSIALMAAGVR